MTEFSGAMKNDYIEGVFFSTNLRKGEFITCNQASYTFYKLKYYDLLEGWRGWMHHLFIYLFAGAVE